MAVWFVGYTPDLATASMIAGANSQGEWVTLNGQTVGGSYIASAAGSTNAGPMWGDAMKAIAPFLPDTDFSVPDPTAIQGRMVTVPSVYGYSPSDAADVLRQAGFNPVVGPMVSSSEPLRHGGLPLAGLRHAGRHRQHHHHVHLQRRPGAPRGRRRQRRWRRRRRWRWRRLGRATTANGNGNGRGNR